ncbi:Uncharacterised protein [Budvicia aquatica]|uniref:Helicase/UvrB N-terminal domain-containing protein n=1 Tax=Budvicia aquatica TaxID=82979 RepID=A0A484ZV90_9GAMM|nr:Uncharacterised protein [Budvicia aquatica]
MLNITPNFSQDRALNMLRRDWKQHNSFMVYSPTGSGKTGLAASSPTGMFLVVCAFCLWFLTRR